MKHTWNLKHCQRINLLLTCRNDRMTRAGNPGRLTSAKRASRHGKKTESATKSIWYTTTNGRRSSVHYPMVLKMLPKPIDRSISVWRRFTPPKFITFAGTMPLPFWQRIRRPSISPPRPPSTDPALDVRESGRMSTKHWVCSSTHFTPLRHIS